MSSSKVKVVVGELRQDAPLFAGLNPDRITELNLRDSSFTIFPKSIGQFSNLTNLNLSNCYNFEELPEFIGKLTSLTTLDLSGCDKLKTLPMCIGNLTGVTILNLTCCENLTVLPDSIGKLTGLTTLDLSTSYRLIALPDSVRFLTSLSLLDLSECESLYLPKEQVNTMLESLRKLDAYSIRGLIEQERVMQAYGDSDSDSDDA